jgi:hypothetical protein
MKRRDRFSFAKLGKLYDAEKRIVFAFVDGLQWVNDVVGPSGEQSFLYHSAIHESLGYKLNNEYLPKVANIQACLTIGQAHPQLLSLYFAKHIPIEVLIVFDDMFDLKSLWSKLDGDPLWQELYFLMSKYRSFFKYSQQQIHKIVVDFVVNNK